MHNKTKYCNDIECVGGERERALYERGVWGGLLSDVFPTHYCFVNSSIGYLHAVGQTQTRAKQSEQHTLWRRQFCLMGVYKLPWNIPVKHLNKI